MADARRHPGDDPPLGDLMTKAELNGGGANFAAVIERHRMRLRELAADAHRVLSSPYPSKDAKAKARAQIEAIAEASAPDVDGLVEHLSPIMFATKNMQSQVYNVETPAIAFHEVEDGLGFMIWLHRDQVIARVEKEIDGCSDDKAALCEIQRSEMAATINADTLEVHRRICALIWHAEQQHGQTLDFASDTPPEALLGIRLVVAPRAPPAPGSSPGYAYDIFHGGR
jgi:hypothetical protein